MPCSGDDCNGQRMVERMRRVSGSLIFKGMNTGRSDRVKFGLPLFSYDGGVVLNHDVGSLLPPRGADEYKALGRGSVYSKLFRLC